MKFTSRFDVNFFDGVNVMVPHGSTRFDDWIIWIVHPLSIMLKSSLSFSTPGCEKWKFWT